MQTPARASPFPETWRNKKVRVSKFGSRIGVFGRVEKTKREYYALKCDNSSVRYCSAQQEMGYHACTHHQQQQQHAPS